MATTTNSKPRAKKKAAEAEAPAIGRPTRYPGAKVKKLVVLTTDAIRMAEQLAAADPAGCTVSNEIETAIRERHARVLGRP